MPRLADRNTSARADFVNIDIDASPSGGFGIDWPVCVALRAVPVRIAVRISCRLARGRDAIPRTAWRQCDAVHIRGGPVHIPAIMNDDSLQNRAASRLAVFGEGKWGDTSVPLAA